MEFLAVDIGATVIAALGYLATVVWHDITGES
jgi:hypothetical protein